MNILKVPLALNESGNLLNAEEAQSGNKYHCPSCGGELLLRKGEINAHHFAHKASKACTQETITHSTAKKLILNAINDWKTGKSSPPILKRKCQKCNVILEQLLPEKVDSAVEELALPNGFRTDIGLISRNEIVACIEIRVTHKVDEEKQKNFGIPYVELEGFDVLANPTVWTPIVDCFNSYTCRSCKEAINKFHKKVHIIAQRSNIDLPSSFYRYSYTSCWKCKKNILVFTWPSNYSQSNQKPLQKPIPRTIVYRYSKTAGHKYWANTCPYCKAIQGDFFLYNEPDGPFFSFRCSNNFENDLESLASYLYHYGML